MSYIRVLQRPDGSQAPAPPSPTQAPTARGGTDSGVRFGPIDVPTPTADQLDRADARSSDAVGRGAAIYFAQGCQTCHGAVGDAPGNLGLARGGGPEAVRTIRQGRPGMPAYSQDRLTDAELSDLQAYLATIGSNQRRQAGDGADGGGGRPPGTAPIPPGSQRPNQPGAGG